VESNLGEGHNKDLLTKIQSTYHAYFNCKDQITSLKTLVAISKIKLRLKLQYYSKDI